MNLKQGRNTHMFRLQQVLLVTVTAGTLFLSGANAYAEEASGSIDLNGYACKDVMRLSGNDRDIALGLLHGYVLGEKNKTSFITEELTKITDNYLDYCLDHPMENALQAFQKLSK